MRRPSIRRRLIFGCLAVAAIVLGFSKFALYREVEGAIRREFDEQLLRSANLLSKSSELEAGGIIYEWKEALEFSKGLDLDGLFQLWDLKAATTTRSPDLRDEDLVFFHGELHEPVYGDFVMRDRRKVRSVGLLHYPFINSYGMEEMKRRGNILRIEDYPQVVVCARDTSGMELELRGTRWRLMKTGLLTLAGISLAIVLIIRWTLAPLERFAAGLVKRSTEVGAPVPAIPEDLPVELFPLATAFNDSLEKVELARAHEKDFAFSAAHQLRTPIAGVHAILELAHSKPRDGDDLHQRIGAGLAVTREIKMTINTLMRLARLRGGIEKIDAGIFMAGAVLSNILETEAKGVDRNLTVYSDKIDRTIRLSGDEGMFRMLVSNLIENAFRYTPDGGEIWVETRIGEGYVVEVSNDRGDFSDDDAERIFRPFQRGRRVSVNSPGAGLGLALAKEIAGYLGGKLELVLDASEVKFRVILPL